MIILSPGVKIAPGGSLKIKNTVKVKENARIDISGNTAISSGGRLVISNSKIMSLSSGLWGGIFANEAGAGIQLSNAIIEKANYGLSVTQKADSMKIDRSSFLQCDTALMLSNTNGCFRYHINNSSFTNNTACDIYLSDVHLLFMTGNIHTIVNSNNDGAIKISNSTGIYISGDSLIFKNGIIKRKGFGAKIVNSSVSFRNSTFNNLLNGIRSTNTSTSANTLILSSCAFKENLRGIDLRYGGKVTMYNNTFTIPDDTIGIYYGAVLTNISNYSIDENRFSKNAVSNNVTVGLSIANSGTGTEIKSVKNNIFDNTYYGCIVNGANRCGYTWGLVFKCNSFSGTRDAIRVVPVTGQNQGIANLQGSNISPSCNSFFPTSENTLNIKNGCAPVSYYYSSSYSNQQPTIVNATNPQVISISGICSCLALDASAPIVSSLTETMESKSILSTTDEYYDIEKDIDVSLVNKSLLSFGTKNRSSQVNSIYLSQDEINRWDDLLETKQELKGMEMNLTDTQIRKLETLIEANPYDRIACWASNVLNNYRDTVVETIILFDVPESLIIDSPDTLQSSVLNKWLRVAPNPSNGLFAFHISDDVYKTIGRKQITISNLSGIVVWQKTLVDERCIIPDRSFSSGTYTCSLIGSYGIISTATVIVR